MGKFSKRFTKLYCYLISDFSVEFHAQCDGKDIPEKEIAEAFNALSPEKLKSLFPLEVKRNGANKQEVSFLFLYYFFHVFKYCRL